MRYFQFDRTININNSHYKLIKISLLTISLIIIISSIIYSYYLNNSNLNNTRRKIDKIEGDITILYNYTETMSDFIVDNYKSPEINLKLMFEEIKNIRLSADYFKEVKEQEINQEKLKENKLQQIQINQERLRQEEIKQLELNKKKEKAINLIKSYIPNFNDLINLVSSHLKFKGYSNDFNCLKGLIKINNEELFNRLIDINYDTLEVSFNYLDKNTDYFKNTDNILTTHLYTDYDENNKYYNYSHYIYKNYKENIIKNPIYQIIKNNLEIDYTYTEPNLTDQYNNKSKYFQQSSNYLLDMIKYYPNDNKYYETYENDTSYLYYKYKTNFYYHYNYEYNEYLIENKIIINNPNQNDIYNKHPYKFICDIPSMTTNNKPFINNYYRYDNSHFSNHCYGNPDNCRYLHPYGDYNYNNINNIERILNYIYDPYYTNYYYNNNFISIQNTEGGYRYYSSNINYELDKNRGTRFVKNNLTNNLPNNYYAISFYSNYFIEKVFIDFPLISIYDEYEYIQLLISTITDIYNLPIIPPIKFN